MDLDEKTKVVTVEKGKKRAPRLREGGWVSVFIFYLLNIKCNVGKSIRGQKLNVFFIIP